MLEGELVELKAEKVAWEVDRRRLERELEVLDDKSKDLTRDLSRSKDAEAKAIQRYDRAVEYNREVDRKMEELRSGFDVERKEFVEKLRVFKENLEGLRGQNTALVGEKAKLRKLEEELRVSLSGKEGELRLSNAELLRCKGLRESNDGLVQEKTRLEAIVREKDERIEELNKTKKDLEKLLDKLDVLENRASEIKNEKNDKIKELEKEKEGLEREKQEVIAYYKRFEESYIKLEADVMTHFCLEAKRNEKFASSKIGMIIAGVMNAIDLEPGGADSAFVSQVNDMKCSVKLETTSEEAAKTTVLSEEELSGENGAACNQKRSSPQYIDISDSDADETPLDVSSPKRGRESPTCLSQNHSGNSSSDGSLNQRKKIKKLEQVFGESAKRGQAIATLNNKIDHKFSTPCNQTAPAMRKCETISSRVKYGIDGNAVSRSNKNELLEYMEKCQQKQEKNAVECVADMTMVCEKDPEFCAKAVCALYRNGLLCSGQRGLEKSDIDRGAALSEYLVKGDPNSGTKGTVDKLKERDPGALDTFRKIARECSNKLLEIFKSNKDPLFSYRLICNIGRQ